MFLIVLIVNFLFGFVQSVKLLCINFWAYFCTVYRSDFQPGFRRTQGFREHLSKVPRLVRRK